MLKNRYSSGDSLGGLVLGQQSQRRQKVANRTKQMLEALLRRDSGRGTKKWKAMVSSSGAAGSAEQALKEWG